MVEVTVMTDHTLVAEIMDVVNVDKVETTLKVMTTLVILVISHASTTRTVMTQIAIENALVIEIASVRTAPAPVNGQTNGAIYFGYDAAHQHTY
jgi:hypothetical protein